MENKKIKICKVEIEKDNRFYFTENGICGSITNDMGFKLEIYKTPIQNAVKDFENLFEILSDESFDILFAEYETATKKTMNEMEIDLLNGIVKTEKHSYKGYSLIEIILNEKDDLAWVFNLFALGFKIRDE